MHFIRNNDFMIQRDLQKRLLELASQFPAIAIMGPRQSGKTTLSKTTFPEYMYVTLEDLDTQAFAKSDPRGFLDTYSKKQGLIIDEAQRVPELFSYLQGYIDKEYRPGFFILTGSQNFLLQESITQTLAGRIALLSLFPLSVSELRTAHILPDSPENVLTKGFYPRLYDQPIEPALWYSNYIATYIEKDVRNTLQINNLMAFQIFLKLCAARTGNIINYADLARDCDISPHTAKSWLSILKSSYIIDLVSPYYNNFSKRVIKSPKLYFYDTGIACFLLGIKTTEELAIHPLKGAIFESFVFSELSKYFSNRAKIQTLYFWRDVQGHEVDFLIEQSINHIIPIEVKARKTITDDFFKEVVTWKNISQQEKQAAYIVYAGNLTSKRKQGSIVAWNEIDAMLE